MYVCIYIYIYICIHIYIYIYYKFILYNVQHTSLSLYIYIYIDDLPLLIITPLIKKTLGGKDIVYYQFRRRRDYPHHKIRFLVRSTPLIITPPN